MTTQPERSVEEIVDEFRTGVQNAPDTDEYIAEYLPELLKENTSDALERVRESFKEWNKSTEDIQDWAERVLGDVLISQLTPKE